MSFSAEDVRHMARALHLAERGLYTTHPNPRVGAVVVKDDVVVGEGFHAVAGGPHAEIEALRVAGERARGATVYVTLEPCCHFGRTPPCTHALIAAGVARVVAAMQDPNPLVAGQGAAALQKVGIDVAMGLLAAQAEDLNRGFVSRFRRQRPWVRCKLAMSLDGRTAAANGESQWITSEAARADGQRWRARSSAVLTGIGTLLADDPQLNVRLDAAELRCPDGTVRQPLRVIADSQLRMPASARVLHGGGEVLVFTAVDDANKRAALNAAGATVLQTAEGGGRVDLQDMMYCLCQRGMNEVLVEAGALLSGALLEQGLIDEFVIYMAPSLLGDGARGLLHLPALQRLDQRATLEIADIRAVGGDWRIIAFPRQARASH